MQVRYKSPGIKVPMLEWSMQAKSTRSEAAHLNFAEYTIGQFFPVPAFYYCVVKIDEADVHPV